MSNPDANVHMMCQRLHVHLNYIKKNHFDGDPDFFPIDSKQI